ncbi:MAG: hypothetical protein IJQ31_09785 [Thermoguttaceae bacterium]|nr:hypothetical protein [Thermoguttaceae bacterium]
MSSESGAEFPQNGNQGQKACNIKNPKIDFERIITKNYTLNKDMKDKIDKILKHGNFSRYYWVWIREV